MTDKVFIDTNIFIYAIDSSPEESNKSKIARHIIKEQIQNESGVISLQVVQEFYVVSTQKIQRPLSTEEALEFIRYISIFETVHPDLPMIVAAIQLHQRHSLSFWDALIIEAAKVACCRYIFSEDFQDNFHMDHLIVKNPFL